MKLLLAIVKIYGCGELASNIKYTLKWCIIHCVTQAYSEKGNPSASVRSLTLSNQEIFLTKYLVDSSKFH